MSELSVKNIRHGPMLMLSRCQAICSRVMLLKNELDSMVNIVQVSMPEFLRLMLRTAAVRYQTLKVRRHTHILGRNNKHYICATEYENRRKLLMKFKSIHSISNFILSFKTYLSHIKKTKRF